MTTSPGNSKNLTSLVGAPSVVKGLKGVLLDNRQVHDILNKHLAGDRDIIHCQGDLLDAGLEDYAQL